MNQYLFLFKTFLTSQQRSKATVKNYLSDISRFIRWYEYTFSRPFSPDDISGQLISEYKKQATSTDVKNDFVPLTERSLSRHLISLGKFFSFLKDQQLIRSKPEVSTPVNKPKTLSDQKENHVKLFKSYLYESKVSALTIKNYAHDINQFLSWLEVIIKQDSVYKNEIDLYKLITEEIILSYRNRLVSESTFSPLSINRKLSSLRKYLAWLFEEGLIGKELTINLTSLNDQQQKISPESEVNAMFLAQEGLDNDVTSPVLSPNKSKFPPFRVISVIIFGLNTLFDKTVTLPLVFAAQKAQFVLFKVSGEKLFKSVVAQTGIQSGAAVAEAALDTLVINGLANGKQKVVVKTGLTSFKNLSKRFYDPLNISLAELPVHHRIYINLRHKRPQWYKKYHEYRVVHYLHFALLLVFIGSLTFWIRYNFFEAPNEASPVFASLPSSPPRILSFKGRLTDNSDSPITAVSPLRFSLYNSKISSGSALLWQEINTVYPDENGNFIATLGHNVPISEDLFQHNPHIYLGITKNDEEEMSPRQKLATTGLAEDSQSVQGLKPITVTGEIANTLLALDSAGNLAIGGSNGPTFQATSGTFKLSGQALVLATNEESSGNVVISPDGLGIVDLQKPLQNTTENNNVSSAQGSVEVDDTFAVLASSSAVAALTLQQDSTGNFISATGSGTAKFTLDYLGNAMFAGNLALNGGSLTSNNTNFQFLPDTVINLTIGSAATDISIGASTGNTSINNNLVVRGNTTLGIDADDKLTINGKISGNIIPAENAKFDLGSENNRFNNAYLTNLFLSPSATTSGFLKRENESITFMNQSDALLLGGSSSNALIKLAGKTGQDSYLNAGKVGIGTSGTLTETLQVYGDVRIGTSTTDGCLKRYDGTAIAGTCSSDVRFKKDIKPITGILEKVASLNPVTYSMRSDEFPEYNFGEGTTYGLIAQEVELLFPELVETDQNGYKMVKYGPELTLLSLASVKELYGEIIRLDKSLENITQPIDQDGNILIIQDELGEYKLTKADGTIIDSIGTFAKTFIGNLNAGFIKAREGVFDSFAVTTTNFSITGMNIREYILSVVENSPLNNSQNINTNQLAAKQIKSDFISPLASDSLIGLDLSNSEITIRDSQFATGSAVARFDRQGNATLSGTLTAKDASISGTLRANKIIANEIEGLDDKLATLSADQLVTNIYNIYNNASSSAETNEQTSSSSATIAADLESDNFTASSSALFANVPIMTEFAPLGSNAASLAYVPSLNSDFTTINQGLMVLGTTSVNDIAVAGQLAINGSFILSENSINVLGSNLEIQSLRQGIISMMGGLVTIDLDGNLNVSGNAKFAKDVEINGKLSVNLIAPVPGSDLVIQLPGAPELDPQSIVNSAHIASQKAANKNNFVIKNASGSSVLAVNNLGDIVASGTATFKDATLESLNIVRGVSADTSAITTDASSSAGIAKITAGYKSRTIYSNFVKGDSLIYISPRSNTSSVTPYLSRQTPHDIELDIKGSFTVEIPEVASGDISFNWWVIN